jgi:argininosuccinate lyase
MGKDKKLWGGRFRGEADSSFESFNSSFAFDRRLIAADIRGSVGHCNGLETAGVLTKEEADKIREGLGTILERSKDAQYLQASDAEDVHSFVEERLVEMIGDTGRKLHTGRSRNDQVTTDLRLWLRDSIDQLIADVRLVQTALLDIAEKNREAVLPGYTHLQRAQPILFAHWSLAYFEMLGRDRERLDETRKRVNVLPLGSGALAGVSFGIDREAVARELGFDGVSRNSLDAVADRDFCVEFACACSLIMVHLSRFAEEVVLYSTTEFGFFQLSDAVATGSSLMPQKKNPDSMELVRGKAGRVFGQLISLLTMMKGLPLAYNKDMQEDKEAVFDAYDTTRACLQMTSLVLANLEIDAQRMQAAASQGMMNATELADYLVRRGMPFRQAHETVGRIVMKAIENGVELHDLALAEMRKFSPMIEADVIVALSLKQTLGTKLQIGGTAPKLVAKALETARQSLSNQAK